MTVPPTLLLEGTTNILLNPSAEADSVNTGTNASGNASTITKDTTAPVHGTYAFRISTPGATANEGIYLYSASGLGYTGTARTFAFSASVWGAGSLYLRGRIAYTDASNAFTTNTLVTATGTATRKDLGTLTLDPAKTVNFIAIQVATTTPQTVVFFVDAAQIEEKRHVTPFTSGTRAPVYATPGFLVPGTPILPLTTH